MCDCCLLGADRSPINNYDADGPSPSDSSSGGWIATWSPMQKRVFGVVMSLVSGFFYGTNFDPPQVLYFVTVINVNDCNLFLKCVAQVHFAWLLVCGCTVRVRPPQRQTVLVGGEGWPAGEPCRLRVPSLLRHLLRLHILFPVLLRVQAQQACRLLGNLFAWWVLAVAAVFVRAALW